MRFPKLLFTLPLLGLLTVSIYSRLVEGRYPPYREVFPKKQTVKAMAAELSAIPRTIANEPAYKTKPKYCLVVFGPEARKKMWLVLDGDVLYVDKNGNGDLTEKGKALSFVGRTATLSYFRPFLSPASIPAFLRGGRSGRQTDIQTG